MLDKAIALNPWMTLPNGQTVPIGDSGGRSATMKIAPELATLSGGKSYAVADLTASGYAIVRSDPAITNQQSMLFVTGMAFANARK